MDRRAVPAPYTPTSMDRFVGGFRQGLGQALFPTLGRVAAVLALLLLAGIGVVALLA